MMLDMKIADPELQQKMSLLYLKRYVQNLTGQDSGPTQDENHKAS